MIPIQVFDPPMCCSTGVCGLSVDPELVRFAADLDWLRGQGVLVERFNLAQQPEAFAANDVVPEALEAGGNGCLPMVVVDGQIAGRGEYPDRDTLAAFAGLRAKQATRSVFSPQVKELVAIAAAVAGRRALLDLVTTAAAAVPAAGTHTDREPTHRLSLKEA